MTKRIEINLGYACNNNCLFCGEGENRELYLKDLAADLTLDKVKEEIRQFSRDGYTHITFLGGEPTIRRDFVEIVLFAKSLGFETIFLTTNARMLSNARYAKELVSAGINAFCVSLHGADEATHDALTRSARSFTQAVHAMDNLRDLGVRFSTSTVITRLNYTGMPALAELLLSYNPIRMLFSFPFCTGNSLTNFAAVVPRYSESMPFVAEAIELAREKDVMITVGHAPFCVMLGYEAYADILYWGSEDESGETKRVVRKFKAKNVEDGRVVDVHGKDKVKKQVCRSCAYRLLCEGVDNRYAQQAGVDELLAVPGELLTEPKSLKSKTFFYRQLVTPGGMRGGV